MLYSLADLEELSEKEWNVYSAFGALYLFEMGFDKDITISTKICAMIGLLAGLGGQLCIINGHELLWIDKIFEDEYKKYPVKDERSWDKYLSVTEKKLVHELVNRNILPQGFEKVFSLPKNIKAFMIQKTLGECISYSLPQEQQMF